MLNEVMIGVIIFILCSILAWLFKKFLPKIKAKWSRRRTDRAFGFSLCEVKKIEEIPVENRTKRQKKLYQKYEKSYIGKYGR